MARFSDEELSRLKKEISLERLVEARGIELKRHGADLVGRCCFHEDKTPSLVISPSKNVWHCLGACQAGGSVVDWVMKAEGVSFRHAVELLRADAPVGGREWSGRAVKGATVRKLPAPVSAEACDAQLLRQVVSYYHERLKQSAEALAYLESRGLKSSEMVERFQLGFADRTLGLRLPLGNREAGAAIRTRLQKLGVLRESGHEHFNGSVVFPILDERGEVLGMYGRKVTRNLRPGTPLHLYLPGPHRGAWNAASLAAAGGSVILCEALFDAATFWCAGFRNVLASYGVEGFTEHHLSAMKQHRIEDVFIAYDRDDAGERAAEKLSEQLCGEGFNCYRVEFPRGMDANEYAKQLQPPQKGLQLALRSARWMGKGRQRKNPLAEARPLESKKVVLEAAPALAIAKPLPLAAPSESAGAKGMAPLGAAKTEGAVNALAPKTEIHSTEKSGERGAHAPVAQPSAPPEVTVARAGQPVDGVSPKTEVSAEQQGEEVVFTLGERRYRVRGLSKNTSFDVLRVNLLCSRGQAFHVDTVDLYSAKARALYVKQAAEELRVGEEVLKNDIGQVLLKLEELQEQHLKAALTPKKKTVTLEEPERQAALQLLNEPNLLERILRDFEKCGVVGEETNKLVGYLAATSRKLEEPLAVIIQSSSAAGKTALMDAVLSLVPEEERVKFSAMTGQSLFYMGDTDLKHKVLAIVEEEGASRASYALKLLQSEGELTIASTGKDPQSGRLVTHEYRVEGPVQLFLTTTAIELDEELLNRCLVLTVDEEREQTRAIHRLQRERQTLEGLLARHEKEAIVKLHRNAQRLLRPLAVVNPFARELTFLDDRTRTRRDHVKYLTLIRTLALLHQYQRPVKTVRQGGQDVQYVEVTREDLAAANKLAHQVLGRSLDELPPQTRRLLMRLEAYVLVGCERQKVKRCDYRFTRREVREATGWGNTQLKVHLQRLGELEYLACHRAPHGAGFVYELLYDGQGKDGTPFLAGLLDVEKLGEGAPGATITGQQYDAKRSALNGEKSGSGRPPDGPKSGPGRSVLEDEFSSESPSSTVESRRNAHLGGLNGEALTVAGP